MGRHQQARQWRFELHESGGGRGGIGGTGGSGRGASRGRGRAARSRSACGRGVSAAGVSAAGVSLEQFLEVAASAPCADWADVDDDAVCTMMPRLPRDTILSVCRRGRDAGMRVDDVIEQLSALSFECETSAPNETSAGSPSVQTPAPMDGPSPSFEVAAAAQCSRGAAEGVSSAGALSRGALSRGAHSEGALVVSEVAEAVEPSSSMPLGSATLHV